FPSLVIFFFHAEDGIRVFHVTGVQTCALPILPRQLRQLLVRLLLLRSRRLRRCRAGRRLFRRRRLLRFLGVLRALGRVLLLLVRSEERRVGDERNACAAVCEYREDKAFREKTT